MYQVGLSRMHALARAHPSAASAPITTQPPSQPRTPHDHHNTHTHTHTHTRFVYNPPSYTHGAHTMQILMLPNFRDFPSTAFTVEFWLWSVDRCRPGAVFSYAAGDYEQLDNALLIFDYNSW